MNFTHSIRIFISRVHYYFMNELSCHVDYKNKHFDNDSQPFNKNFHSINECHFIQELTCNHEFRHIDDNSLLFSYKCGTLNSYLFQLITLISMYLKMSSSNGVHQERFASLPIIFHNVERTNPNNISIIKKNLIDQIELCFMAFKCLVRCFCSVYIVYFL